MFRRLVLSTVLAGTLCLSFSFASAQSAPRDAEGHEWWQHAVFYEIYPRSYADSNNDGIGDLKGITSKLDYLKQLGVDAIWLTPCFPSPQVDFGYDVSDYQDIDPMYGTLADFDRMASEGTTAAWPASVWMRWILSSKIRSYMTTRCCRERIVTAIPTWRTNTTPSCRNSMRFSAIFARSRMSTEQC